VRKKGGQALAIFQPHVSSDRLNLLPERNPQNKGTYADGKDRKHHNEGIDAPWRLQVFHSSHPTEKEQEPSQENAEPLLDDGENISHVLNSSGIERFRIGRLFRK
jgi:hypothetical protein